MVVDTLVHRLGPVGIPFAYVFVAVVARINYLRRQVLFQGHGFGFPHPDVHNAVVLLGGVIFDPHLADDGGVRSIDKARYALPLTIEGIAVVLASDGAGEQGLTLGQPRAAMGAPVEQGVDFVRLATKENDVLAKHLHERWLLGTDILLVNARVPIFPESHGRHVVEGADLGGSLRLTPGHLGVVGQRGAIDGAAIAAVGSWSIN